MLNNRCILKLIISLIKGTAMKPFVLLFVLSALLVATPTIQTIPDQQALVGKQWSYTPIVGSDEPGQLSISFTAPLPMDFVNNVMVFTPTEEHVETHTITLTVTDENDVVVSDTFSITVKESNNAPTLTAVTDQIIDEDGVLVVTHEMITSEDIDSDTQILILDSTAGEQDSQLVYTLNGNSITPDKDFNGTFDVMVSVSDGIDTSDAQSMQVTVSPMNDAPKVSAKVPAIEISSSVKFSQPLEKVFTDPDEDELTLTAVEEGTDTLPSWITLDGTTLIGSPTAPDSLVVIITASDGSLSSSISIDITVTESVAIGTPTQLQNKYVTIHTGAAPIQINGAITGIVVTDLRGRIVHQQSVTENSVDLSHSLTARGVFLLKAETPNGIVVKKFSH